MELDPPPWASKAAPSVYRNSQLSIRQPMQSLTLETYLLSMSSPAWPSDLFEVLGYRNVELRILEPSQSSRLNVVAK